MAANELLRDPQTLREPLVMFPAASGERAAGHSEEAAFLFLAARLRTSRQILFEKGDRPQLASVMIGLVGPLVMPVLESDPPLARRVVARLIEWDRATPDPFRDRPEAKGGDAATKLADIDAALTRLGDQFPDDPSRVAKARIANQQVELEITSKLAKTCGPGTLDSTEVQAAIQHITSQAESFAKMHPFVVAKAGGTVRSVSVGSYKAGGPSRLPSRITVTVSPETGRGFFAEVDAQIAITSNRKLGAVSMSIACVTSLSIGSRDGTWNDVCQGDSNAVKPSP